jgi:hypothetical protein
MDWRKELSKTGWTVRVGVGVLVVGAAIDLVYHAVFLTILPVPGAVGETTAYIGHWLTFIGMIITLGGILRDGMRNSRRKSDHPILMPMDPLHKKT